MRALVCDSARRELGRGVRGESTPLPRARSPNGENLIEIATKVAYSNGHQQMIYFFRGFPSRKKIAGLFVWGGQKFVPSILKMTRYKHDMKNTAFL